MAFYRDCLWGHTSFHNMSYNEFKTLFGITLSLTFMHYVFMLKGTCVDEYSLTHPYWSPFIKQNPHIFIDRTWIGGGECPILHWARKDRWAMQWVTQWITMNLCDTKFGSWSKHAKVRRWNSFIYSFSKSLWSTYCLLSSGTGSEYTLVGKVFVTVIMKLTAKLVD